MHAGTLAKASLVSDGIASHHLVIRIHDEPNHLDLGDTGRKVCTAGPLQLQPDRHIHLFATIHTLTKAANAIQPDIDNLSGVIHLHEGSCALGRSGDLGAGNIDRVTGAGGQKGGTTKNGGQRQKSGERLVFHAAHPICFFRQQQLTCAV